MAHAVVMRVKLPTDGPEGQGVKMLNEMVIPQAKAQTGFRSGIWMNDGGDGLGIVVFDTAENAQSAASALKPPPGGPELLSSSIYEVGAEA